MIFTLKVLLKNLSRDQVDELVAEILFSKLIEPQKIADMIYSSCNSDFSFKVMQSLQSHIVKADEVFREKLKAIEFKLL